MAIGSKRHKCERQISLVSLLQKIERISAGPLDRRTTAQAARGEEAGNKTTGHPSGKMKPFMTTSPVFAASLQPGSEKRAAGQAPILERKMEMRKKDKRQTVMRERAHCVSVNTPKRPIGIIFHFGVDGSTVESELNCHSEETRRQECGERASTFRWLNRGNVLGMAIAPSRSELQMRYK